MPMWKSIANRARPASIASAPLAGAQSSEPRSSSCDPSIRSLGGSMKSQISLEDTQELLTFNQLLVQKLGEDLQQRDIELGKLQATTREQLAQIDNQRAELHQLSGVEARAKLAERQVTELKKKLDADEDRITVLAKAVSSLRNGASDGSSLSAPIFELNSAVKDALIDHLQRDVDRLTQETLDHDRQIQKLLRDHDQKLIELRHELETEHKEETDLLRSELDTERKLVTYKTWELAKVTKQKDGAEEHIAKTIIGSLPAKGKSDNAELQTKQLSDAVAYAQAMATDERLFRLGLEVELFHLTAVCNVAQAREEENGRLRIENTELKLAKQNAEWELETLAKNFQTREKENARLREQNAELKLAKQSIERELETDKEQNAPEDKTKKEQPASDHENNMEPERTQPTRPNKLRRRPPPINTHRHSQSFQWEFPLPTTPTTPITPHPPASPHTPSKRKTFVRSLRHPLSLSLCKPCPYPPPKTAPSSIDSLRAQLDAADLQHKTEKNALQDEIQALKQQLSENVRVSEELMNVTEEAWPRPASSVYSRRASEKGSLSGDRGSEDKESAGDKARAYAELFGGDIA